MNHARLKGLTVALNMHFAGLRRHIDVWDEATLQRELALAAALLGELSEDLDEAEVEAQRERAQALWKERTVCETEPLEGYALWAETYHTETTNPLTVLEQEVMDRLLGEVRGLRVLDVGCGTGRHALALAARGAEVTGADPCDEMRAVAEALAAERQLPVRLLAAGFGSLPREAFDLAVCNLVLCHLPEVAAPIAEMAACLRPGGRLILTDLHYFTLLIGWRTSFSHDGVRHHVRNYLHPVAEYLQAFRAAGLDLEELEDIVIDERLRPAGMGEIADKWGGFPFGIAFAARKT